MKDFDLEGLSREMPYKMPEHFLDDMTERVVAQIGKQRKHRTERRSVALFASAASVAAVALLFLHPFGGGIDMIYPTTTASHSAQAWMRCYRI